MASEDRRLELPALSRPFYPGMLYDARSDTLITGDTLWDKESLDGKLRRQKQPHTHSRVLASSSYNDVVSTLNLPPLLKASLLGGKADLNGPAKYLKNRNISKDKACVVLYYSATTYFQELTEAHLAPGNIGYRHSLEKHDATHVVTAVLYGAQVFFVFERELASSENKEEIEKDLRADLTTLYEESKDGDGSDKILKKWKNRTDQFSCTFYGDVILEKNPVTESDAIRTYSNFSNLLGEGGVPMKVWLCPLVKLDPRAVRVRQISVGLISRAEGIVEQLRDCEMQVQDLQREIIKMAASFPEMKEKMHDFRSLCKQCREVFQEQLAEIIPSIQGRKQEEEVLRSILTKEEQSPFSSRCLAEFLEGMTAELDFVKQCCLLIEDVDIILSEKELREALLDPKFKFIVSFTFTSLKKGKAYLQDLKEWINKTSDLAPTSCAYEKLQSQQWFKEDAVFEKAREYTKTFSDFAKLNKQNGAIHFIISSVQDEDHPGVSIYLYKKGKRVSRNFELPSTPPPLRIGDIRHDSMQLSFDAASDNVLAYCVEHRSSEQENWTALDIRKGKEEAYLVTELLPNTSYQFCFAVRTKIGSSPKSSKSHFVKTLPTSPPGKPQMLTVGSSDMRVTWKIPSVIGEGAVIKEYSVEYREEAGDESLKDGDKWNEKRTGRRSVVCHIDRLKPQTPYRVRVSAICADGALSAPSEEVVLTTSLEEEGVGNRLALQYLQESKLIETGKPSVYALPLQKAPSDAPESCPTYQIGKKNLEMPNKVIMVMGEARSGKTTLINWMVNYILGVQWEDDFRFKLIPEVTNGSQDGSQVPEVATYVMNYQKGFLVPHSLTVIDTQGFGSNTGKENDKRLIMQIIKCLSTSRCTDHIDGVCFVARDSFGHLTCAQKYVFDFVSYIFKRDIKDNIQVLVTFAEEQAPRILGAIKEQDVPCAKDAKGIPVHFKFNNSAVFARNVAEHGCTSNSDETLWRWGTRSMENFFDSLYHLERKSLACTKEVLWMWKKLETDIKDLQNQIQAELVRMEDLRKTQQALEEQQKKKTLPKDFRLVIKKAVLLQPNVSGSKLSRTSCQGCLFTCHDHCVCPDEKNRRTCLAIDQRTGRCKKCPGRCAWNVHFFQKSWLEYETVSEEKLYEELKQNYPHVTVEERDVEGMLWGLSQRYEVAKEALVGLIQRSSQSLQRLQKMASKLNPLSTLQYIDLLITSEELQKKSGYLERIRSLREVRELAELREQTDNFQGAPVF